MIALEGIVAASSNDKTKLVSNAKAFFRGAYKLRQKHQNHN